MGDASSDLPDRGQLFAHHQLAEGLFQLGIRLAQFRRALIDTFVQLLVPRPQPQIAVLHLLQQPVQMLRHLAYFAPRAHMSDPRRQVPLPHAVDHLGHPFQRRENAPRHPQKHRCRQDQHGGKCGHHPQERIPLGHVERRFEETHVQHPHPVAKAVGDRQIARDIPVIDHKCAVQPDAPLAQHGLAHFGRHPRAKRAHILEKAHVG